MAQTTIYIPSNGWVSQGQKMRLKVVYDSSASQTTMTVTPQFYGPLGTNYALWKGKVQYSTDGGATKTTLWDFTQQTGGGSYPYAAPLDSEWANMGHSSSAITEQAWPTSKQITVSHGSGGTVTVTFYTNDGSGVQTVYSSEIAFSGSGSHTFGTPVSSHPVYIYKDGAWTAYECYIYRNGNWVKHRPYIYKNGNWVAYG